MQSLGLLNNEFDWVNRLVPHWRFSYDRWSCVGTTNRILQQPTPKDDSQHPLPPFLKFGKGSRSGHLLRILGVGFGPAVDVGNTIGTGILRTPGEVADT